MRLVSNVIVGSLLCVPSLVFAADQCADILRNGSLQSTSVRHNQYIQQIIQSRFLSSTYQQSKTDKSAGFGATLGSYFFTGDYDEARYNQKKLELQKEDFKSVSIKDELDVALTSGDPLIVDAWKTCMTSRSPQGWLELSFEPKSGAQIFGNLVWHPGQAGQSSVTATLKEEVIIDKTTILSGKACLKEGAVIGAKGCKFSIRAENSRQPIAVIANADVGSAEAYVPPRLTLVTERRSVNFDNFLKREWVRTTSAKPATTLALSEKHAEAGWTFDPSTAKIVLAKESQRWVHDCKNEYISADLYSVAYGYEVIMSDKNPPDRAAHITCSVNPSIEMVRHKWVPMD